MITKISKEGNLLDNYQKLENTIYLSDIIDEYGPGTYLVHACRIIYIENSSEYNLETIRILSGRQDVISLYDNTLYEPNICNCSFQDCSEDVNLDLDNIECKLCNKFFCNQHINPAKHKCIFMCHHNYETIRCPNQNIVICHIGDCQLPICLKHYKEHIELYQHSNMDDTSILNSYIFKYFEFKNKIEKLRKDPEIKIEDFTKEISNIEDYLKGVLSQEDLDNDNISENPYFDDFKNLIDSSILNDINV